jgi:NADP-reducing hydrogenase subunit HndD
MEKKVKVTIDNKEILVPADYTVMEAADLAGINIPRLCFLKGISETSSCRICVVEIEGIKPLKNSCTFKVFDGMKVKTNTPRIIKQVKINLELIAGNHQFNCWACPREHNCELLELLRRYNVDNHLNVDETIKKREWMINQSESIVIDSSKCVLCGRCVDACEYYTGLGILNFNERGFNTYVGPANQTSIDDAGCIYCGKCIQSCPTGALRERDNVDDVFDLLHEEGIYTVVQIAPATRAGLGEEFGLPMGTNVEPLMYAALKELGFNDVVDVNFSADLTIMEEGTELIERLDKFLKGEPSVLPLFTSCSPGWIRYVERYAPEFIPNVSSCKSPQQMNGAIVKNYYAKKIGVPKDKIKVVSIMPCIAKKYEASRPEMEVDGIRDVDIVLTTRELARLIKRAQIDFVNLEPAKLDSPLAQYTGAGVIFGATGGVMEAALRTVKALLEEKDEKLVDITEVRGVEDIKEATLTINGLELNFAVVHGAVHFPEMLRRIKEGKKQYAFVEFMGCTGGCVFGGGQPIIKAREFEKTDVRAERAKALYQMDQEHQLRRSHENPHVIKLYEEFLGHPGSHLAHKLLHTTYSKKDVY